MQEELKTLNDELAFMESRLLNCDQEARPVILSSIRQIKRDIKRNTAKLRDRQCN